MYLSQHDTTRAALAMLKGMPQLIDDTLRSYHENVWNDYTTINFWQYYLHSSNLSKIITYKRTATADPYFMLLTSGLKSTSFDCLYNLLGTAYLRDHNYRKAVFALSKVEKHSVKDFPLGYWDGERLRSNPFVERLKDYPKKYITGKHGGYSKLAFAKKMYQLQLRAIHDREKAPKYYFEMAVGLYNTSHEGNAWFMISYVWGDGWYEKNNKSLLYYDSDVNKTTNAEKYFLRARNLSKDPEFKAKCTFMAAKCNQHHYNGWDDEFEHSKFYPGHAPGFENEIRRDPYFKELRKSYAGTRFYKTAVSECSYFRDFLASAETKRAK